MRIALPTREPSSEQMIGGDERDRAIRNLQPSNDDRSPFVRLLVRTGLFVRMMFLDLERNIEIRFGTVCLAPLDNCVPFRCDRS
jgi:hypothetical protein